MAQEATQDIIFTYNFDGAAGGSLMQGDKTSAASTDTSHSGAYSRKVTFVKSDILSAAVDVTAYSVLNAEHTVSVWVKTTEATNLKLNVEVNAKRGTAARQYYITTL
ncbi:MAG: carbohydrate binding domain-containing protein, partial [Oscillospiraceae bacterium]|nr:carbohydrate binding domain-containing protein [Oscillospiraceae bacterium]